jgi:hypothetical protein
LAVFVLAMILLARHAKLQVLSSVICVVLGLTSLYWFAGFVVMLSACSYRLGGC